MTPTATNTAPMIGLDRWASPRRDCARLRMAGDIDPAYAEAFDAARAAGVEMLCYDTDISPDGVTLRRALPIDDGPQSLTLTR